MGKLKRTIKEQQFIKAYIELNGNATKAYHQVFPNVKLESARRLGSLLLSKLDIPITELLDLMGISDHVINQKLNKGLNATTKEGKPRFYVIAKYLDMILRIKAKYPIDETRLKLPGGDKNTSVILRELIYTNKEDKPTKEPIKMRFKKPITVEDTPF